MSKKKNNDYFELMTAQTACCVEASELLEKTLCNFSYDAIPKVREEIHAIEHKADQLHHNIVSSLSTEFITPIDQEDILRLVQLIDDITDSLDEVVLKFYMYDVHSLPAGADEFSKLVNCCVKSLLSAVTELRNFKKPTLLREKLVEVNDDEAKADAAYVEAIHNLFVNNTDFKVLSGAKSIFESLEICCDECEHAADIIEQIIIKNT